MKKIIGLFVILISIIFFKYKNPLKDIEIFIGCILFFLFIIRLKNDFFKKKLLLFFLIPLSLTAILFIFPQKTFINIHTYLDKNSDALSQYSKSLISQNLIEGIWIHGTTTHTIIIKTPTVGAEFPLTKNKLGKYELSPNAKYTCLYKNSSNQIHTNPIKTSLDFSRIYGLPLSELNFHLETIQKYGIIGFEVKYQSDVYFTLISRNQNLSYTKNPDGEPSTHVDYVNIAPHWHYFMGTL